ncbi:MAG: thioredoxin family protein [Candidatus Acidiferrales bacterium]
MSTIRALSFTALSIMALSLLIPAQALAQSTFAPLDQWSAAVEKGDAAAIAAFYSKAPPSQSQTPAGTTQDVDEEPHFWASLAPRGLANLDPKVLEVVRPQPGVVAMVLRIEFTLRTDSGALPFVVSAGQTWFDEGAGNWRIVATRRGDPEPNPPRRLPEPAKPNPDLYPAPEDAPADLASALASAASDHKRVLLVFGGNWCYDCQVLNAAFHSPAIAPLVDSNFHVVHINIGEVNKNLALAAKYDVPLDKGVPALAVLDSDGKLLYSQQQGEFEDSVRIGPADVKAFLEKWKPPRLP